MSEVNEFAALIQRIEAGEEVLSFSSLREFAASPLHFMRAKLRQKRQTPAMVFGSALHCRVLQPDLYAESFAVMPKFGRSKASLEQKAAWMQDNESRQIITEAAAAKVEAYAKALMNNPVSLSLLREEGEKEKPFGPVDVFGLPFRGVVDFEGWFILDLKTTKNALPRKFQRAILEDRLHWQAAIYTHFRGVDKPYYLVAIDGDLAISVHEVTPGTIAQAVEEIEWYTDRFKMCRALDRWHESYEFYAPSGGIFKTSMK